MAWLRCKTETVILIKKVANGKDAFNVPIYVETEIEVKGVLVQPSTSVNGSADVVDTVNLSGKKVTYALSIPKNDNNNWQNTDVIVRGERYRTIGIPTEVINPPLDWNKKIMVERYE